ncbi:MAG: hypothetical protein NPIRA02_09220 [Nitrospirales bacterium]|nr:MAG: hypothetical protein NPIRA02_09220 [Nitrospirales bacterium]
MSNYAGSCPHCGETNPTAPKAVLVQDHGATSPPKPQDAEIPLVELTAPAAPEEKEGLHGVTHDRQGTKGQWLSELCDEWNSLTSAKKTALQMLFGFALLVGVVLFVYGLVS